MALLIKVLLYSTLILLVHSQQLFQNGNIGDLVALSRLLQTAAQIAYPVTNKFNNVVGNLRDPDSYQAPFNRRGNANPNNFGLNRLITVFQDLRPFTNLPTRKGQDPRPRYYDYGYAYDYYNDYVDESFSYETEEEFGYDLRHEGPKRKQRPNLIPNNGREHSKPLPHQPASKLPLTNLNAPANGLSGANDVQPKVIYVVVNPGDVNPEMNKDNTILFNKEDLEHIKDGALNTADRYNVASNPESPKTNNPGSSVVISPVTINQTDDKPKVISI